MDSLNIPLIASGAVRPRKRARYVSKACTECRKRKAKCSGLSPEGGCCERCQSMRLACSLLDPSEDEDELHENGLTRTNTKHKDDVYRRLAAVERRLDQFTAIFAANNLTMEQPLAIEDGPTGSRAPSEHPNDFYGEFAVPTDGIRALYSAVDASPGMNRSQRLLPLSDNMQDEVYVTPVISSIHVGSKRFDFPSHQNFQSALDYFFDQFAPFYACIDEADVRARSSIFETGRAIETSDIHFVALIYAILATVSIVQNNTRASKRATQRWHALCEELRHREIPLDRNDMSPIQTLILQVSYLSFGADRNLAYLRSGEAARLCFQYGLHNTSQSRTTLLPAVVNLRQRVFYTAYFVERRTAQSVGRPYAIRDLDVAVQEPTWLEGANMNSSHAALSYMRGQIFFARFCGRIWDSLMAASVKTDPPDYAKTMQLDQDIATWLEHTFPVLFLHNSSLNRLAELQKVIVETLMLNLRLIFRRPRIISLNYDAEWALASGQLANTILTRILLYEEDATSASGFFKFHASTISANPLLVLASLLLRGNLQPHLYRTYAETFKSGVRLIRNSTGPAQRIAQDMGALIQSVFEAIGAGNVTTQPSTSALATLDSFFGEIPTFSQPTPTDNFATTSLFSSFNLDTPFLDSSQFASSYDPNFWTMLMGDSPSNALDLL